MSVKIAAIQIQRKKIGLTEERYRALLLRIGGVASSRQLTEQAARRVYQALTELATARTPQARYVWVLWGDLQPYLSSAERNGAYLSGLIRRSSGASIADLSDLSDLEPSELHKAIEALKQRLAAEKEKMSDVPF